MSWRHGGFHDSCTEYEVVTGLGRLRQHRDRLILQLLRSFQADRPGAVLGEQPDQRRRGDEVPLLLGRLQRLAADYAYTDYGRRAAQRLRAQK